MGGIKYKGKSHYIHGGNVCVAIVSKTSGEIYFRKLPSNSNAYQTVMGMYLFPKAAKKLEN